MIGERHCHEIDTMLFRAMRLVNVASVRGAFKIEPELRQEMARLVEEYLSMRSRHVAECQESVRRAVQTMLSNSLDR